MSAPPVALDPHSASANELYELALRKAEEEEYEEALTLLAEGRRAAPGHVGLYLTAAQILAAEMEDFDAAERLLAEAEVVRPGAPMVAYARADLAFQRGDFGGAEAQFRSLTEEAEVASLARAGVARSLVAQARELMDRGRHDVALGLLQQATTFDQSAAAHLNQGLCYHVLGGAQEAYEQYSRAIELDPESPVVYFHLGRLMADCGQMEKAAAAFAQTLTVDPDYPDARHRLASAQATLGSLEAAANVLQPELARDPECAECHYLLALAYMGSGNPEAAIPHLEWTAARQPGDFLAAYNLGAALVGAGRFADALPPLQRARQIDPALFVEGWTGDEQFRGARARPEFADLGAEGAAGLE
jgi:tetratricopeptide (TPR) repeat protein